MLATNNSNDNLFFLLNVQREFSADFASLHYQQYRPLSKEIFLEYIKNIKCQNCKEGKLQDMAVKEFEKLFEEYIDENYSFNNFRVRKTNVDDKVPGDLRNTVPDYFGIKWSLTDRRKSRGHQLL